MVNMFVWVNYLWKLCPWNARTFQHVIKKNILRGVFYSILSLQEATTKNNSYIFCSTPACHHYRHQPTQKLISCQTWQTLNIWRVLITILTGSHMHPATSHFNLLHLSVIPLLLINTSLLKLTSLLQAFVIFKINMAFLNLFPVISAL